MTKHPDLSGLPAKRKRLNRNRALTATALIGEVSIGESRVAVSWVTSKTTDLSLTSVSPHASLRIYPQITHPNPRYRLLAVGAMGYGYTGERAFNFQIGHRQ
jgi:hypothetical protein